LSTLFAGVAGVLIAPLFNVEAHMGTVFGLKAFAVAILGGIGSAWGVMLAGLLFGMVEAMVTATLGSAYTQIIGFGLVIVVLALKPGGLFGRLEVRKV
jgi:branched-chain amino acid transport system permease protein